VTRSRSWILWGAILLAGALGATVLLGPGRTAGPSTLSAAPEGWMAARAYLERRGVHVALLDRPLEAVEKAAQSATAPGGAAPLVLAFPWRGGVSPDGLDALRRRLAAGNTVVYAYSGLRRPSFEDLVAETLGLELDSVRERPSLSPRAWYRYVKAEWTLSSEDDSAPAAAIGAPDRVPKAPAGASIFLRGEKGVPAVFSIARGRGRVIALPADALSNARIGNRGNADLLESLGRALGEEITFDEHPHGLSAADVRDLSATRSLDLLLAQLALIYGLCVWGLARRFGPPWQEPPEIASSTSTFLLGLGALHRKLGHSAPALVRLLDDAESLDPRVRAPAALRREAYGAGERAFVDAARFIARLQRGR
jgi:hypothetical protein